MRKKKRAAENGKIGSLDFETDPFQYGRVPEPFACGIYFDRQDYTLLWDADSKTRFLVRVVRALERLPPCILYAHNGGKFDFHYLIELAKPQDIAVRNGRVVSMRIGKCLLKDSWPLMPFPLAAYRKTPIDYAIFEANKRNKPRNRAAIESYLLDDCADLLELVTGFREIVGERDTIGAAAFLQMRKLGIKIESLSESHDEMFRPYYFGGRVEAFKRGIHEGNFKYFDINSAYPFAMLNDHPHGAEYVHGKRLPRIASLGPCFVRVVASSRGALPLREDNGNLSFPHTVAEFFATGWEIAAGIQTRTLDIHKVIDVWKPLGFINFREYVETFYAKRMQAKHADDKIKTLAYKFLLNSGYGKFAQNPREFKDYRLEKYGKNVKGWEWETDFGAVSLWSKPSYRGWGYYDVATGASITGFVRAMLWKAICSSQDVLYADTDSLICRASRAPLGDKLGQWKLEGNVKRAAIAGKKLYGIEWAKAQGGERFRVASKGARLTFKDIVALCRGDIVEWENDAPTFTLGNPHFIRREIRAT